MPPLLLLYVRCARFGSQGAGYTRSVAESGSVAERTIIRVHVRLFAAYREAVGTNKLDLDAQAGDRVRHLLAVLAERYPRLHLGRGLIAVNQEYVGEDFALHDGDEVALIPPVSGGR